MLTDRLFTGQREITGLGIYYYGARFYSPYINRCLSADTIVAGYANPQSLNRYSYVVNNPLRYTDPTGHRCVEDGFEGSCGAVELKVTKKYVAKSKRSDFAKGVLQNLLNTGPEGIHAAEYILEHNVQIEFKNLLWGGGGWGFDGNITIQEAYKNKGPDDPFMVGLVAHEAYHLEQGHEYALTKIGEIEAWKLGFTVQRNFSHKALGTTAEAIADLDLGKAYSNPQPAVDLIHQYNDEAGDSTYNFMFDHFLPTYPLSWHF